MADGGREISFTAIVHSVIGAILISLIMWLGNGMQDAKIQFTQIAADIRNLTSVVTDVKDEWKRDRAAQALINTENDKRITALEYNMRMRKGISQ